ncbi:phosphoribosyltransferase family protein [Pararcticibacter amylolyticus]|uniref:Phosphoribosyltransferase n=1 Tax=Pararcticibacter amylolyticus TaxID=2173175 RepID=A0A2U2PAM1_9SPHI|nr:phosphoribosyltransferase family protein [Pararcticibacter amylolyticus]PWG78405.1 phosphoribosyltransferase [Pararcticibacter amylolyticus]
MNQSLLILGPSQIQQKITRIAYQVWEDNIDEPEIVIAGIIEYGYVIAGRLKTELERISGIRITLMKISLDKNSSHLEATTDLPVEICRNKVVIVIDDVINSGRTLAYGIGLFLNIPLKKLRTVALMERSHRIFPVSPDYVGTKLATVTKEHVDVLLDDQQREKDAVYLR